MAGIGLRKCLAPPNIKPECSAIRNSVLLVTSSAHQSNCMCFSAPRRFSVPCQSQSLAFLFKLLPFSSGLGLPTAAFLTHLKQNQRCSKSPSARLLFSLRGFYQAVIRWRKALVSKCNLAELEASRSSFSI